MAAVKVEGKGGVHENPLVPNLVLREMYRKLVEARMLATYQSKGSRARLVKASHGACRMSVTQGLGEGDLVLDSQPDGLMKYLLGMKLVEAFTLPEKKKSKSAAGKIKVSPTRALPFIEDAEARLFTGLGAAMLQKTQGNYLTVLFLRPTDVSGGAWRRALTLAADNTLPVIVVALPDEKSSGRKARMKQEVSGIAQHYRLPAIQVDVTDAVALYRVAQESIGRIRSGGGPVVIEGVSFKIEGKIQAAPDSISQLGENLLRRRSATKAWMSGLEKSFRGRLAALTEL